MNKRTFKQAFNTKFHDKANFDDFLTSDFSKEIDSYTMGNGREVFKPTDKLKKYLRFIDGVILRYLAKDEDVVHSFIKQKSTLTAIQAHKENRYFFKTDIEQFYSNIKRPDVLHIFKNNIEHIPISDIEEYIDFLADITTHNDSIPVGFPTSPRLSNAFLFTFDQEVKRFCEAHKLIYTRYADDIIISSANLETVITLRDQIQYLLKRHVSPSLKLNKRKTHITHKGDKVKLLGLVILPNGRITIDAEYKNKIEVTLHFFANDKNKYQRLLDQHFNGNERSLFGLLHYAKSIDQAYLDKLQRKYGIYTLRSLMEGGWNDNR